MGYRGETPDGVRGVPELFPLSSKVALATQIQSAEWILSCVSCSNIFLCFSLRCIQNIHSIHYTDETVLGCAMMIVMHPIVSKMKVSQPKI